MAMKPDNNMTSSSETYTKIDILILNYHNELY